VDLDPAEIGNRSATPAAPDDDPLDSERQARLEPDTVLDRYLADPRLLRWSFHRRPS